MTEAATNSLDLAALALPIIALTASFAVNSIDDEDDIWYRGAVGGFGIFALIPAAIATCLAVVSYITGRTIGGIGIYVFLSVFATIILTSIVLVHESLRGQELDEAWKTLLILSAAIVVVVVIFEVFGL